VIDSEISLPAAGKYCSLGAGVLRLRGQNSYPEEQTPMDDFSHLFQKVAHFTALPFSWGSPLASRKDDDQDILE
jgi:hypothetical protein